MQEEEKQEGKTKGMRLYKECVICLEEVSDAVVMNCGHGGLCFECGTKICESRAERRCHLCRKVIINVNEVVESAKVTEARLDKGEW